MWKPQSHWPIADWLGIVESHSAPRGGLFPIAGSKSVHISTAPITRGRKRRLPGSIPPRRVWKPQPHLVIVDWLGLMEPARGESCPSGQRRGRAAPGGETFPSPGQKYFHTCTTPTTRGQKRRSPGSTPPRRVWKPQPRWVIVDWLELMEPAHGEGCSSGQRRGPAAPGGDKFPSPDQKYFHICTTSTTWGRKRRSPGRCLPAGCESPNPSG